MISHYLLIHFYYLLLNERNIVNYTMVLFVTSDFYVINQLPEKLPPVYYWLGLCLRRLSKPGLAFRALVIAVVA